jgi:HD-GYP domain-containing protein (c-di-GMP phosphodiesterase class II)
MADMAGDIPRSENSAILEIARKIRLSIFIYVFVILTLFAVIVRHLYEPVASYADFLPEVSSTYVVALSLFLALICLYLAVRLAKQILRIVRDYSSRLEKILNMTRDLREEVYGDILLEKIMDYALSITDSDAGSILLVDNGKLVFKIVRGEKSLQLAGTSVEFGKGISGWVAETGKPLRIAEAAGDARFNAETDAFAGHETRAVLCVPLKAKMQVIGVLELLNRENGHGFRERDEDVITFLAAQAAISIIRTKFLEDQKNYEIHLTEMLLEAIDFQIPEKRGHSRRVARYGNIIAKGLISMSEEEKKKLYFASLLHDVGFLKINSDEIFKREEFMKHPVIGYEMISPINFYADIAPFILHHHERYDGHGYPSGLKGEEIPLGARIIAIAEAFDAMISTPSYRMPVSFPEALGELRHKAGTQFDPELVDMFVTNIEVQHTKV